MRDLKLDAKSGYKKSARVVGDVIGKYHPHGQDVVYQYYWLGLLKTLQYGCLLWMVRETSGTLMATQLRQVVIRRLGLQLPLKLLWKAWIKMPLILKRPMMVRMKSRLLCRSLSQPFGNGAAGIAVGMATSIPPHNLFEVCEALIALIKNPDISMEELVTYIPGPRFPNGWAFG